MPDIEITIGCYFCANEHRQTITIPDGWEHRYGCVDDETGAFCPDHQKVAPFAEAQCPGCVGGWGDCDMWRAFDNSYSRNITADDLATLRRGKCPRRTNGSMSFSRAGGIKSIDLSDPASVEAGSAFADAIEQYCREYPAKR